MCNVKPYGYVYITTNLINNKKYIGQKACNYFVESYKGSGTYLWNSINKYGWNNFKTEVIEWCRDQEELDQCERYWIALYDAVNSDRFYNLAVGGSGFGKGSKFSKERNLKMANSLRGRTLPDSVRAKISERMKGREVSEETRKKLSKALRGRKFSDESRKKMSEHQIGDKNHFYGKHHSEESKQKISNAVSGEKNGMYGKHPSDETREKLSKCQRNRIWITDGITTKKVYMNNLDYYSAKGFVRGRKKG